MFFLPLTKTWSQQRSRSDSVRSTFKLRSQPFGLDSCDATGAASTQRTNRQCEFCRWVAEQTLTCSTARLILVFPKDGGGHSHGGPSSIWCLQEFMELENLHDARRCAFGCQLALPRLCSCLLWLVGRAVRLGSLGSEAWLEKNTWPWFAGTLMWLKEYALQTSCPLGFPTCSRYWCFRLIFRARRSLRTRARWEGVGPVVS